MAGAVKHLGGLDAGGAVKCGEGFIKLNHMSADGGFAFHKVDLIAGFGDIKRRLDSGNPTAYDQHALKNLFEPAFKGFKERCAHHRRTHKRLRFLCRHIGFGMHPSVVLPDVCHLHHVGVEPRVYHCLFVGLFVQAW